MTAQDSIARAAKCGKVIETISWNGISKIKCTNGIVYAADSKKFANKILSLGAGKKPKYIAGMKSFIEFHKVKPVDEDGDYRVLAVAAYEHGYSIFAITKGKISSEIYSYSYNEQNKNKIKEIENFLGL